MHDETGKCAQFRTEVGHQWAKVPEHSCLLVLDEWGEKNTYFTCDKCEEERLRPPGAQADCKMRWMCDAGCELSFQICMSCVPVVVRTEIKDW